VRDGNLAAGWLVMREREPRRRCAQLVHAGGGGDAPLAGTASVLHHLQR
jgi:hypothetical protein